jgi:5-methylthioadenosine/S-adenosylhomocysteine deaminase
MTFLRGFADDLPLMEWLNNHVFPVEHHLTKEIVALGARWGMYEMMRTGTTALVDSYLHEESVLSTADQMGMRCIGGEALYVFPSPAYGNLDEAMDLYRDQARRYNGRVQVALMPHSVYTTSDEILRRCVEVSEELDIMIHIHLSESANEVKLSKEQHDGLRPVAYAESLGFLSERTFLAHMVDLEDEEIKLVAQRGAQVIHNPVSNLKLASGIAEVKKMRDAGISVALGTDGACSNNSLDMFESMKLAAILAKGHTKDATVLPANEALKMATEESARIFRTPGLGTLRPNAPADLIALDLDEPNLNPIFNPTSHAVYAASGKDCVLTMVEGRILYDHGVYTDGQYAETRGAICELVNWVQKQAKKG